MSPGGDAWTWGYPVLPARRIGERSLGYERVRQQMMLVASPDAIQAASSSAAVTETGAFTEDVDALFEGVASKHPAICERERGWLDWRYVCHPEHRYRIAMAHKDGALTGYAVARAQDFQGARRLVVCDWCCEDPAEGALQAWLADVARESGVESVAACFSHAGAEFQEWQGAGFQAAPTSLVLTGRSHTRRAPFWFAPRWYTTLGDSDLC